MDLYYILLLLDFCFCFSTSSQYKLSNSIDDEVVVNLDVSNFSLVCPSSYSTWFLPPTLSDSLITTNVFLTENTLQLHLPLNSNYRALMRGQYTCCPREQLSDRHLTSASSQGLLHRVTTPTCCPCCAWPQRNLCSKLQWKNNPLVCLQVFVYTGMVESGPVSISLPWKAPVLLPCPLPFPDVKIQIYQQFNRISFSKALFYNDHHSGPGVYDPHIGLCTKEDQIKHPNNQLICEYGEFNRTLNIKKSNSPPMIPPQLGLKLSQSHLQMPTSHIEDLDVSITPAFRTRQSSNVTVTCEAFYTHESIVAKPPRICFRWRIIEGDGHLVNADQIWLPFDCFEAKRRKLMHNRVSAEHQYQFTNRHSDTFVECEVVEMSRSTPAQRASVRFIATSNVTEDKIELDSVVNGQLMYPERDNPILIVLEPTIDVINLTFFTQDEVGATAACKTSMLSATTSLRRLVDKWVCSLLLPIGKPTVFTVLLQQGNLQKNLSIHRDLSSLLPAYSISGFDQLRSGHVILKCIQNQSNGLEIFRNENVSIKWSVAIDDHVLAEKASNIGTDKLHIPNLVDPAYLSLDPFYVTNNIKRNISLDANVHYLETEELSFNLSKKLLPPHQLCISCEALFSIGVSQSDAHCLNFGAEEDDNPQLTNLSLQTRFLPFLKPIYIENLGNTSFRVTKAYLQNTDMSIIPVFEGSTLELVCSVVKAKKGNSTDWPLILHTHDVSRYRFSLPQGELQFHVRPFSLETRLYVKVIDAATSSGTFICGESKFELKVVPSSSPVVVEPNRPVRYFTPGEIIGLVCRAEGSPRPTIVWRLYFANSTGNYSKLLQLCADSYSNMDNITICSIPYAISSEITNSTVQCTALNYVGEAHSKLVLVSLSNGNLFNTNTFLNNLAKSYTFWIVFPVVILAVLGTLLGCCLWRKSRRIEKAEKLIKMENLLYGRPMKPKAFKSDYFNPLYREVIDSLMPTEELRERWCLERQHLTTFSQPLGTGHYGSVRKGIYRHYKSKLGEKQKPDSLFVALKSPSTELSSLTCFRNEIAHLMKLSGGPNIINMIGIVFGEKDDLRDSLLVLEFCPNTSLSHFIRLMAFPHASTLEPRSYTTPLSTISTISTQLSNEPAFVIPPGACVSRKRYYDRESLGSRRHRGRYNTSLVYQRLDQDSTSIFLRIAVGIANGLEYLAKNNVIHRDLATRNILLDFKNEPKICDFGLAVTLEAEEDTSKPCSGCYQIITFTKQLPFRILPPEALSSQRFYLASDVWEFGLLLWEMFFFTTRKPFERVQTSEALLCLLGEQADFDTSPQCINSICTAPPSIDRPPAVPDEVWKLMCDCWCINPRKRPLASEVRRRLLAYVNAQHSDDDEDASDLPENGIVADEDDVFVNYQCLQRVNSCDLALCTANEDSYLCTSRMCQLTGVELPVYENIETTTNNVEQYLNSFSTSSL